MKYLCLSYYDAEKFKSLSPEKLQVLVSQCPAHDAVLRASGALRVQASLGEPPYTRTIRPRNGKPTFIDGPYIETKEQVGGFSIIDATGMSEALEIAAKHPAALLGEQVDWAVEVRPVEFFESH